jgi:hypothetical protein
LDLVNREMQAGYSWDEALCNLSERTDVGDIKVLVDASPFRREPGRHEADARDFTRIEARLNADYEMLRQQSARRTFR